MATFSNIKVFKNKKESPTFKANGTVLLGDVAEVSFNVLEGSKGLFVKLPQRSYKDAEGVTKYVSEVKIPDEATYKELQHAILNKYKEVVGGKSSETSKSSESKPEPESDGIPF